LHATGVGALARVFFRAAMTGSHSPEVPIRWAESLMASGDFTESLQLLEETWQRRSNCWSEDVWAHLSYLLSLAYETNGESNVAAIFRQKAISSAMRAVESGAAFSDFPELFGEGGQILQQTAVESQKVTDATQFARRLWKLARAHKHCQPEKGIELLRMAWKIYRKQDETEGQRLCLIGLAEIFCHCGEWRTGTKCFHISRLLDPRPTEHCSDTEWNVCGHPSTEYFCN
ncbi:MAG: hypothetical protein KDA80_12585, partial [Planctomycetaceae bacterium]|nr:hypothetical protein [Planctomycetaceae bacterium]